MIIILHFKLYFLFYLSLTLSPASERWNQIRIKDVIIKASLLIMVIVIIATANAKDAGQQKQTVSGPVSVCWLTVPHLAG